MSDSEIVEEHDILVHLDFDTRVEDECFEELKQFKLIGIETDEPILQISDQVYKGKWQDTIGTHIFLEKTDEEPPADLDVFSEHTHSNVKYVNKTEKILKMQRVFISMNENNKEEDKSEEASTSNYMETDSEQYLAKTPENVKGS